jgi:hypothetical protein
MKIRRKEIPNNISEQKALLLTILLIFKKSKREKAKKEAKVWLEFF